MNRGVVAAVAVAIMVAAAGCGGSHSSSSTTGPRRTLTDLRDINQLKTAFNTASGEPRLIILMSPT